MSPAGGEQIVVSYTNLPELESGLPWRVGVHRLAYKDGRFCVNSGSGRVVGPEGMKEKDGVIFNLRDGSVGLIHRMHPNAVFDSLDELWNPAPDYWDEHLRDLEEHTLIRPAEGALNVGAGAPRVATENGLLFFFHEREGSENYTTKVALLDDETGRARSLLPRPDHATRASVGARRRHRQHPLCPGRRAASRRHDLPHVRRGRPLRRRRERGCNRAPGGAACCRVPHPGVCVAVAAR